MSLMWPPEPIGGVIDLPSVLIVEDEAIILMDIAEHLEDEGFKVHEASDADRALALLTLHPEIRLLFTDVDLPGSMDGLAMASAVRDRWPPIKIVVTSGARIVELADMPDGSVFFSKPYQHAAVVAALREMIT
jgi:CheY-like chemotaxis protein